MSAFPQPLQKGSEAAQRVSVLNDCTPRSRSVALIPPTNARAQANDQVVLALAAMRLGDKAEARQALETAIELDPGNSFALRSIGSLLVIAGTYAAAVESFSQALVAASDDLITTFKLAQPYGEQADRAKDLRSSIARRDLRADQTDGLRQHVVSYCLQALRLFEGMDQQRFLAVLSEVGAIGQGGLQIDEPDTSLSFMTPPGSWSDLALARLIHVGMKRLMPGEDSGLAIGAEYEEA